MASWPAEQVFHAYLDEVKETGQGVFLAKEARKLLFTYLDRGTLAQDITSEKAIVHALSALSKVNEAHIVRSLFMSAHAGFEQFLRELFDSAAEAITHAKVVTSNPSHVKTITSLTSWQIQLAGEGFRKYFEPLAHMQVDYTAIAAAISAGADKDKPVILNGKVFGYKVGNIDQSTIDSLFKRFNCVIAWSKFSDFAEVQILFEKKKNKETQNAVADFFEETLKVRNRIAHTQGELNMSREDLSKQIAFLKHLSTFLQATLLDHLTPLLNK